MNKKLLAIPFCAVLLLIACNAQGAMIKRSTKKTKKTGRIHNTLHQSTSTSEEKLKKNYSSFLTISDVQFEEKLQEFEKNISNTAAMDKVTLENNAIFDLLESIYSCICLWKVKSGAPDKSLVYKDLSNTYLDKIVYPYPSDTVPHYFLLSLQKIFPAKSPSNIISKDSIQLLIPIKKVQEEDERPKKYYLQVTLDCNTTQLTYDDLCIQKFTMLTAEALRDIIQNSRLKWHPISTFANAFKDILKDQKKRTMDLKVRECTIDGTYPLFNTMFDMLDSQQYITKESAILNNLNKIFASIASICSPYCKPYSKKKRYKNTIIVSDICLREELQSE